MSERKSIPFTATRDEFSDWLRSLPEGTKFCEKFRIESCPIAKFSGHETWQLILPGWAEQFIRRYDDIYGDTLQQAISIVETL